MKIYVGNLSFDTAEEDIRRAFESYGEITSVSLIMDRDTGKSKGFGFVEMASKQEAQAAMDGLNGKELNGRTLNVNEARPKTDSGPSGNRGGGGGGGRKRSW